MVCERDLGKHDLEVTELLDPNQRAVARNKPSLLEPFDARQARARRESDRIGQFHIGNAPTLLQLGENAQVQPVKRAIRFHLPFPPSGQIGSM